MSVIPYGLLNKYRSLLANIPAGKTLATTDMIVGGGPPFNAAASATVPYAANQTQNNPLLKNKLLAADLNEAFSITGGGQLAWGGGGGAGTDLTLYRFYAGMLYTNGGLTLAGAVAASTTITASQGVTAHSASSNQTKIGGFGPGSEAAIAFGSAADATIYRTSANALRIAAATTVGSSLTVTGQHNAQGEVRRVAAATTDTAYSIFITGESYFRSVMTADGKLLLGGGGAAGDTGLRRLAPGLWALDNGATLAAPTMTPGSGTALMFANVTTAPSTNPTGGPIVYAEAGALKVRGTGGTVTTLGAA